MFSRESAAILLWRLRRQSALYVLGSGASAPIVPMAPALMWHTAKSYVDLGSMPIELAPKTVMTKRIQVQAVGQSFNDRPIFPGTPEPPYKEILDRLPHGGAVAAYMHQLGVQRYARRRIPNYLVLRAFRPSLLLNYNLDGLATDTCGDHHVAVPMHGSVGAEYGSAAGADLARVLQEYSLEMPHDGLHPIGPELVTDERLQRKLRFLQRCSPAFVMIVGYSFGRFEGGYDDCLSLATFIGRFRDMLLDVYVCDPRPFDLAGMLGEELRSKRVHAFPVYWNVLAWCFAQVLTRKLDAAHLDFIHELTLDDCGSGFLPEEGLSCRSIPADESAKSTSIARY
jgi:hypothetical protein